MCSQSFLEQIWRSHGLLQRNYFYHLSRVREVNRGLRSNSTTSKPNKKRVLHEGLCYIFFRFKNFESLKDGYFQNLEDKYSGETLGCLYLILGVNRELLGTLTFGDRVN